MEENVVLEKSFHFALRIVHLYQHLSETKKEYVLSKFVLHSGTLIGARVKTAQEAENKMVFVQMMNVALQKATETEYWLQLLRHGHYLEETEYNSISADCLELTKLLTKICKTAKGGQ
jgi:four helix bundle protein